MERMEATIKPGTRCECRVDVDSQWRGERDMRPVPGCCLHWESGEDAQCYEPAVRMVTVLVHEKHMPPAVYREVPTPMCEPCAQHAEGGARERKMADNWIPARESKPMSAPMEVEDSHAKLAAEMRGVAPLMHQVRKETVHEWAARVEQLGARRCLCGGPMKCEKCGERWFMPGQMNRTIDEAREAEIATEVKWITEMCERYWNEHNIGDAEIHSVLASIRASAARLGGAAK